METLESCRVCRLCGQQSGICINIFDKNDNHMKKINAILPILVHELDVLPKHMCHRCSYKLEEFYKFYIDCLKTDTSLKSQLSWMRKSEVEEDIVVPMVQIKNLKIKSEPPDYDVYELDPIVENVNYINSMSLSVNSMRTDKSIGCSMNNVDRQFRYGDRFDNCRSYKCHCDTSDLTKKALSIDCIDTRPRHNVNETSRDVDLDTSSEENTFINIAKGMFQDVQKSMTVPIKEKQSNNVKTSKLDIGHQIKTELPETVNGRTLRPRKQSINYLGSNRKEMDSNTGKKKSVKVNHSKQDKSFTTLMELPSTQIEIHQIKVETPESVVPRRSLRPRSSLVDYHGPKRKKNAHSVINSGKRLKQSSGIVDDAQNKKHPNDDINQHSSSNSINMVSNELNVLVKRELISDNENESADHTLQGNSIYDRVSKSFIWNSTDEFGNENEIPIKIEKNIHHVDNNKQTRGRLQTNRFQSKTNKNQPKPTKVALKRFSTPNIICSSKNLRSHDLRLRNGKIKSYEPIIPIILGNMRKKLRLVTTSKSAPGKKLPQKVRENLKAMKVPTSLKTADNIKHHCDKCCTQFMNKELYMLHACYYD